MTESIMSPDLETSESRLASPHEERAGSGFDDLSTIDALLGGHVREQMVQEAQVVDRLLGRDRRSDVRPKESVAKEQQVVTIVRGKTPSTINDAVLLQDKIKEIRELADKLALDAPLEQSREILYCIYTRAAEVIGRNSVEAIKADAIHRISALASAGVLSGHVPRKENPEEYLENKIIPLLDADMRPHAFDMNLYRAGMRNFYQVLGSWRSRGRAKKVFAGR